MISLEERRRIALLSLEQLREHQWQRITQAFERVLPHNRFYAEKFAGVRFPLRSWDDFHALPSTHKDELARDVVGNSLSANITYPLERYVRLHRTSGTHGKPMVVLDTAEDWQWWLEAWQYVLDAAEIGPEDRVFMAFSFGPFIGFWSAFDAVIARGSLAIPGGGMSTLQRLELIETCKVTTFFCTPSYALHMAETAAANQIDPAALNVRRIIVAGEPGGSIPAVRNRIEQLWNARVIDHAGASEIGPWGYADREDRGLVVNEAEFYPEFISLATGQPAQVGESAELVMTNLGRLGSPVFRYRTGDVVTLTRSTRNEGAFAFLPGGILGRTDDMLIVRGVNIFPSAIEQIVRGFPEISEFRVTVRRAGTSDEITVEIEDRLESPDRVARELQLRLGLKVEVRCVPLGTLPRFEGKGRRFLDLRSN